MERKILTAEKLAADVASLNGWQVEGLELKKHIKVANFTEALAYVNRVGAVAEDADHHPDITFGWGYVDLALTTHDRGGITDVDIALARQIDRLPV
jgi:4a-hydroxytetrahydrobiopterin dehydratase